MREGLRLEGTMIARGVKRLFDQRGEPRAAVGSTTLLEWRGASLAIGLVNVSAGGAMIRCDKIPHIGEAVALKLANRQRLPGVIRWVRDGRIGIHFALPLE